MRADRAGELSYRVEARNEAFLRADGKVFRSNEIWRTGRSRRTGNVVEELLVKKNRALVKYAPAEELILDVAHGAPDSATNGAAPDRAT